MRLWRKTRPHRENSQTVAVRGFVSRPILVLMVSLLNITTSSRPCDETAGDSSPDANCTHVCPCKHTGECARPYACPGGCREGYARAPGSGVCLHANDGGGGQISPSERRPGRSASGTTLYRFAPAGRCYRDGTMVKRWVISTNITSVVEKVHILFDVQPSETEYFLVTFRTSLFSNVSFNAPLTLARNGTYVSGSCKLEFLTFANSLQIESIDQKSTDKCPGTGIAAVLLYGQPVCPYGKWGVKCGSDCRCPCNVAECHPSTGHCWTRSYACSPGTFGPSCSLNCSEICGGSPRECHLTTGYCKRCDDASRRGARCERQMTPGEVGARLAACRDVPRFEKVVKEAEVPGSESPSKTDRYMKTGSSVTLVVATAVVVIAFLVACVAYVLLIRHCAGQKLRNSKMAEEERNRKISLMSYSELRKEYTERFLASHHAEAEATGKEEPPDDVVAPSITNSAAAAAADKQMHTIDTRKRSMAYSWTNPLLTIITDVPQNAGTQPGSMT